VETPAGEHTVELRYESRTLRAGVAISLLAYAALIAPADATVVQRWRKMSTVDAKTHGYFRKFLIDSRVIIDSSIYV
jgi:hypothetical protein